MTEPVKMDNIFTANIDSSHIELYRMDCLEGMREYVQDASIDVVVTSPPYNIGKKYNYYDDTVSRDAYLNWMEEIAVELKRCLKEDGSFFLNMGGKPSDPWVPMEVAGVMRRYFVLQNTIHWIKSIAIEKRETGDYPGLLEDIAVGHYQPVNSHRFLNQCHEYIFHLTKTGKLKIDRLALGVKYQDKSNIKRWNNGKGGDIRCRGNTWFIPYRTIRNGAVERPHPASFPPKLVEMCIKLHGLKRTKLVLDPFNGIGNTTEACVKLKLNMIGFEIDGVYFSEAVNRFKSEVNYILEKKNDYT